MSNGQQQSPYAALLDSLRYGLQGMEQGGRFQIDVSPNWGGISVSKVETGVPGWVWLILAGIGVLVVVDLVK
jgi:hypothetical protein